MSVLPIPLPHGYIKVLAARLNCHVNSVRRGWQRRDPVWIKTIMDFSREIEAARIKAIRDAGFPLAQARKIVRGEQ